MSRISQREARRLRSEVRELREMEAKRLQYWRSDYPGGVNLCNILLSSEVHAQLRTARKLGHAVVVTTNGSSGEVQFYALPLSK